MSQPAPDARPFASGVIEGFYGPPWAPDRRVEVLRACAGWGMTHYVWAPKDDPKHRDDWRAPYDATELDVLAGLAATGLTVGWSVAPGLSMAYDDPADCAALAAKVDQVVALGIGLVVLALDDLPPAPGLGPAHSRVTTWLCEHLDGRADVWMVPLEYTGVRSTAYLDALADGLPADVLVGWTGCHVVNDEITTADARARAAALGDRPPLLWDNWPVNDGMMADRLFLGPFAGREPGLLDVCAGLLANPMVQARASLLPLASVAAWCRGDDVFEAWRREAEARGWRTFAEAVEAHLPADLDSPALDAWLEAAEACGAPGLEDEVQPWIDQVHAEACVARLARRLEAVDLAADPERAVGLAVRLVSAWRQVRRSEVTAFGPRLSMRPVIDQDDEGRWRPNPDAVTLDANVVDVLARRALAHPP